MSSPSILIGIQARSTSERFPRKHHELIGDKRLLDHVIDCCLSARDYINRQRRENIVDVAVLTPFGDDIAKDFCDRVSIFEGPEFEVLDRYYGAANHYNATHIVRVTGDCPLLPAFIVSKCISLGLSASYDYLSNVDEYCRTSPDGLDCEFLSKAMLRFMYDSQPDAREQEHVTLIARERPPRWAKRGFLSSYFDEHDSPKFSVDTKEDLERVRAMYERVEQKFRRAQSRYPRHCIHRI